MAIHQTKKQTDLEKRLRLLRQQVYGKGQSSAIKSDDRRLTTESYSDITYLRQDLFKILTLSTLAIGTQLALFFLLF